jgi:glycine cleavage system H protein
VAVADVPADLWYTTDHEWVRFEDDGMVARVGITDFAQRELGDVVFVEAPAVGVEVIAGAACGTIEAVKAVAELMAPVSGRVVRVNEAIDKDPAVVNQEPYGGGWLFAVVPERPGVVEGLLSPRAYLGFIGEA